MLISEQEYIAYMFMIEQKMLDNKIKYNEISLKSYEGIEKDKQYIREENKKLCEKWLKLNKPEKGTPNRFIEFFNPDKQRMIKTLSFS